MAVSAIENRYQLQLLIWYGVGALGLLFAGMLLAADLMLVAVLLAGLGWMITLPYHAKLSAVLAISTFSSALIVPFLPGRPYAWEAAALLAWSGLIVVLMLRQFPPDFRETLRRNRWIYLGIIIYCATLVLLMSQRGFGLRIFGSSQQGGRLYLQQLICAILPLLFATVRMDEKLFTRALVLMWLLSITYFISDFAFTFGGAANFLLRFFEVPGDALNFETINMRFGIRRFQSFLNAGMGLMFLLLARHKLTDFIGRSIWWLLPSAVGIFALSLLSGHRGYVLLVVGTMIVLMYAQRFFTMRTAVLAPLVLGALLIVAYGLADRAPLSVQRAISFLPGIRVNPQASADAASTMHLRRVLRHAGIQMIPEHFWVGRGFTKYLDMRQLPYDAEMVDFHLSQGMFYNGFIGLLVNTGISGTVGMMLVITGGTALSFRVLRLVRRTGSDRFLYRAASVLAGYFLTSAFFFLFLHGDSELALKNFALQLGMLILAERLMLGRFRAEAETSLVTEAKGDGLLPLDVGLPEGAVAAPVPVR
jgi:hypothetical protein